MSSSKKPPVGRLFALRFVCFDEGERHAVLLRLKQRDLKLVGLAE